MAIHCQDRSAHSTLTGENRIDRIGKSDFSTASSQDQFGYKEERISDHVFHTRIGPTEADTSLIVNMKPARNHAANKLSSNSASSRFL